MTTSRTCTAINETGERCRQRPLKGRSLCFWHDPEHAAEAEQDRKLGGQRRRREKIFKGAYDLQGITSPPEIRRVLEIAILDALGLDNSVPRSRVLIAGALLPPGCWRWASRKSASPPLRQRSDHGS